MKLIIRGFLCIWLALSFVAIPIEAKQKTGTKVSIETTCTENNGKPCPKWLHRMVGQYPPTAETLNLRMLIRQGCSKGFSFVRNKLR